VVAVRLRLFFSIYLKPVLYHSWIIPDITHIIVLLEWNQAICLL